MCVHEDKCLNASSECRGNKDVVLCGGSSLVLNKSPQDGTGFGVDSTTLLDCDGCAWLWPSEAEQNELKEYIDHTCRKYGARVYHYGQHPRLPRLKYCKQP